MTSIFWRDVKVNGLSGVTLSQKTEETYENGRRMDIKKLDGARIQVGDNYGNCIFTDREGGNMIYKAIRDGKIKVLVGILDSFKTINEMTQLLKDAGKEYKVACR